ncbi:eukaryotic translation initiation factor 2 subunit beta isoform X1 [Cryptomeria japonica]|uniref:eukaryotic translation initiation factor 2 subunit beta isoform X1 n=2 Tax=Cryptomeria japonica TaxID=3369 RepID=UPI0027DA14D7|nr:eukaryotic translation initiation factor 2 subunit beta isoform X1 [Cryptomeria japonica]
MKTPVSLLAGRNARKQVKAIKAYKSSYFSAIIKLQPGYTAGVETAFYWTPVEQREIDFELQLVSSSFQLKGRKMADNEAPEMKEEVSELAPFDPTKKKKKKKVVIQDATDEGAEKATEKMESLSVSDTLTGLKKKKKKPVEGSFQEEENVEPIEDANGNHEDEDVGGEETSLQIRYPWEGSDRDYKYEELLGRVFNILRENNPELAGDRRRTVMRPPQVLREGTKKTVFVNFMDLCKTMHRQPEHVMNFLLAEMGTSGSLDGQQRLVIKGRFAPKNFEGILRRYINEYVICNGCKSPDTILSKENRLFFLRCEQCGCSRSVAPIKAGFVARVARRKAGT